MSNKSDKKPINRKSLKPLRARDKTDSFATKIPIMPSLPMRLLINGRSGSGKSSLLLSLFLQDDYPYKNIFNDGDNIYVFSPCAAGGSDYKLDVLIEEMSVPDSNCFDDIDDDLINDLYDNIVEDYREKIRNKEKPENILIIIDDFSSSGVMSSKRFNAVAKLFCNSRKVLCSIVVLQQSYLHTNKTIRENATGLILFNTSQKSLEAIEGDNNYLKSKKQFFTMFRENVIEAHDFLAIVYSNTHKDMYLNSSFEVIDTNKYLKK